VRAESTTEQPLHGRTLEVKRLWSEVRGKKTSKLGGGRVSCRVSNARGEGLQRRRGLVLSRCLTSWGDWKAKESTRGTRGEMKKVERV